MNALMWNASRDDFRLIVKVAERYTALVDLADYLPVLMDIEAVHCNGCPLKLAELLAADDSNFLHDLAGIRRHIDRTTGQLGDCFWPRYAA